MFVSTHIHIHTHTHTYIYINTYSKLELTSVGGSKQMGQITTLPTLTSGCCLMSVKILSGTCLVGKLRSELSKQETAVVDSPL